MTALHYFFMGYMDKQADIIEAGTEAGKWALDKATTAAIALPALGGLSAGALASLLTSPSSKKDEMQKALVAAELEEAVAELKRRQAIEKMKDQAYGQGNHGRSLHI